MTRNDVIMRLLPKNNGKMRTSAKPNKLYIIRKVLIRAIQKCTFIEFEPLYQKLWAFMSNLGIFAMPAPQIWQCQLGRVTKFPVEKLSTSEVISQKPHGGWKTPPSAFRVKKSGFRRSQLCSINCGRFFARPSKNKQNRKVEYIRTM